MILAALTMVAVGLAATPEAPPAAGFRQHTAATTRQLSGRLVIAPGEITVFQQVPRLRIGSERITADLSLPLVQAIGPDGWSEVGLGRTRGEGRVHLGLERRVALGLSAGGLLAPRSLWVTTWGSQSRETQPGWDVTGFVEVDVPISIPWTIAIGGGVGTERYLNAFFPALIDVRSFQSIPISDRLSLVLEEEFILLEHTILSLRALASWRTQKDLSIDGGLQMPLLSSTTAPLYPQLIAQLRAEI